MADNNPNNLSRLFQTAGTAKPQTGTGYTNLNRLFEANKQNQLGQRVAGDIGTQIGGVQSQLAQQKKQFEEEAEKNKVGGQKDVEQREAVLGRFTAPSSAGGEVSDEDVAAFGRFRSGQYGGPQSLKDTSGLRQTAQQLQGQVSNFSPSGTQELLRRSVGGGKYTQGQSRLDSLLMDRSKLTPVARQAQGLGQEIQRADLAASGQAELNKNLAQQFAKETEAKILGGSEQLNKAAEQQLATAKEAERVRQDQLNALMSQIKGDTVVKLDPQGKEVRDENGNLVYEQKLSGTTDPYARVDEISKKMKELGIVNQNQYEALFGKGSFSESKSGYDKNLADIRRNEVLSTLLGTNQFGGTGGQGIGQQMYNLFQQTGGSFSASGSTAGGPNDKIHQNMTKMRNYIASKGLDKDDPNAYNTALADLYKSGDITEADINTMGGHDGYSRNYGGGADRKQKFQVGDTRYSTKKILDTSHKNLNPVEAERAKALEAFKGATGLAGRSTLDTRQDEFYKTLADSLAANTMQAQGLTREGVASDDIRSNYAALQKLMGKTADTNPYDTQERYKQGQTALDAAQIKRRLGY